MLKQISYKIFLIASSILLSLIILEIIMCLSVFFITGYQNYINEKNLKEKTGYNVMCIGESTTFGQYPVQLQNILNQKYPDKFRIIDCGLPGQNLFNILSNTDDNIKRFKPDIVICMMGINGHLPYLHQNKYVKPSFIHKTRVYKLCSYIFYILFGTEKTEFINYLISIGNYKKAEDLCAEMLKSNAGNEQIHSQLTILYFYYLNDKQKGYEMAVNAINNKYKYKRYMYYRVAIDYNLYSINDKIKADYFSNTAIEDELVEGNDDFYKFIHTFTNLDVNNYKKVKKIITDKDMLLDDVNLGKESIKSVNESDFKKADDYFDMAENLRLEYANNELARLYVHILDKFISKKIKVICMQYPVRSVKSLKNILKDTQYYNNLIFISNEENFKKALKEKKYDEICTDQFAGDFGHCTEFGNVLIAENAAETLTKLIN